MRGGPKKPKKLRELERVNTRKINDLEPEPDPATDSSLPEWLRGDCEWMQLENFDLHAVTEFVWDSLWEELARLGVLTGIDEGKFGRYCEMFARFLKVKATLDKHGEVVPTYDVRWDEKQQKLVRTLKDLKPSPYLAVYDKLQSHLHRMEGEFAIGAASRTRIIAGVGDGSALKRNGKGDPDLGEEDPFDYGISEERKRLRLVAKE